MYLFISLILISYQPIQFNFQPKELKDFQWRNRIVIVFGESETSCFYKEQLEINRQESKRIFKKMSLFSLLRLSVFLLTAFGIYLTSNQWKFATIICVIGIAIFLFLLSKYTDLKAQRALHKRLVVIDEDELKIASADFHNRADGIQFQDPKHFYSLDIDLFGIGSFFQFINIENNVKIKNIGYPIIEK